MIKSLLLVGLGSFVGGIARYSVTLLLASRSNQNFPWPTFLVNISGSFAIGLLLGFAHKGQWQSQTILLLTTGLLGGFTTFSAFSWEAAQLVKSGAWIQGIGYAAASTIFGIGLAAAGYQLAR